MMMSSELDGLAPDLQKNITSFLDAKSLLSVRCLNHKWATLAVQNDAGWQNLCINSLWRNKNMVCDDAKRLFETDAMKAYKVSIKDAKERQHPTIDEICYDLETRTGTVWSVRFKDTAGEDWTEWDPWYHHKPCRKMVLLRDGRVKMFLQGQQENIGDSNRYDTNPLHRLMELHDPTLPGTNGEDDDGDDDDGIGDMAIPMRWRFITQPVDFPARPQGSYIRFSVHGRDVPTYVSRRSPTGNWGFVYESCWGLWASFELPPKPRSTSSPRRRARGTYNGGNNRLGEDDEDTMNNNENNGNNSVQGHEEEESTNRILVDDDTFEVGPTEQWREAFLYNVGHDLPEGPGATAAFDAMYARLFDLDDDDDEEEILIPQD
jgi:hypothetical protein